MIARHIHPELQSRRASPVPAAPVSLVPCKRESESAGHLERQLIGVNVVITTSKPLRENRLPEPGKIPYEDDSHDASGMKHTQENRLRDMDSSGRTAKIRMKPLPRGNGFQSSMTSLAVRFPGRFVPAVEKGVQESSARGYLPGFAFGSRFSRNGF